MSKSKRYTEGVCYDGVAILDYGKMITITEILERLNELDEIQKMQKAIGDAISNFKPAPKEITAIINDNFNDLV